MPLIDIASVLRMAHYVREKCGFLGAPPPYSTKTIVETCFPHVIVTGEKLPKGILEMVEAAPNGRRSILYNRHINHAAQRVSILHGLGHVITNLKQVDKVEVAHCDMRYRDLIGQGYLPGDPIELACDHFAGEVLVPFDVLDRMAPPELWPAGKVKRQAFDDEVDSLASQFNVPSRFLTWRLSDLAKLRKSHFNAA